MKTSMDRVPTEGGERMAGTFGYHLSKTQNISFTRGIVDNGTIHVAGIEHVDVPITAKVHLHTSDTTLALECTTCRWR